MRSSSNGSIPEAVQEPIRIAVIGQAGVGKSALVVRYLTKRFIWEYDPTLECIYKHQTCVDGKTLQVEILDTGAAYDSEDRYSNDTDGQLGWADGVLLVYSVTDRVSFDAAAALARRLRRAALARRLKHPSGGSLSPDSDDADDFSPSSSSDELSSLVTAGSDDLAVFPCVVVVGNKSDLTTERRVPEAEGAGLAAELTSSVFTCCPRTNNANVLIKTTAPSNNGNGNVQQEGLVVDAFVETSARDGGPEIGAAFEAVVRQVLARRRGRRESLRLQITSGQRSPADVSSFRGSSQSLATVATESGGSLRGRFARRLVLLQAVNRLVRKLHV